YSVLRWNWRNQANLLAPINIPPLARISLIATQTAGSAADTKAATGGSSGGDEVHNRAGAIMAPGTLMTDPISAISLGLALTFGTAGLPHILLRFFTVADAKEARKSVLYANGFIGFSATTLGILAIVLSIAFEMQDAAFMVGLA